MGPSWQRRFVVWGSLLYSDGVCDVACYILEDWEAVSKEQNHNQVSLAGSPAVIHFCQVGPMSQRFHNVLPALEQMSEYASLWMTFHIQPIILVPDHLYQVWQLA